MKNILGTLESTETRNSHSRLFSETPSRRALDIVSRPEWRAAIEYRVNESLYGAQRNLSEILFPNIPRNVPTHEEDINARIFAEEEAVRIDRNIEHLVDEEEKFSAEDAYAYNEREGPPSHKQIAAEEVYRRPFLMIADFIKRKQWNIVEKAFTDIFEVAEKFSLKTKNNHAAVFFRDVFSYLLPSKIEECAARKDMESALHIIRLMRVAPYIPGGLYNNFVPEASRKTEMLAQLAHEFIKSVSNPSYNDLWRECKEYGFDMDALKKEIRIQCERELCSVLKKNGADEFFRWLDFALRQDIFSEEELSSIQLLRTAVLDYARGIIRTDSRWAKNFLNFAKECQNANILSADELRAHTVVREAGKKYAIDSFTKGLDEPNIQEHKTIDQACAAFFLATQELHHTGIMKREETRQLPEVIKAAEQYLVGIFSGKVPIIPGVNSQDDLYIAAVTRIVRDAGIGRRKDFDNVPAIKKAREENRK